MVLNATIDDILAISLYPEKTTDLSQVTDKLVMLEYQLCK